MRPAYRIISIKSFRWTSFISALLIFEFTFSSCQIAAHRVGNEPAHDPIENARSNSLERRLSERELTYQKGLVLFNNAKFAEAAPFFLKVSQNSVGDADKIYDSSLWKLTFIHEKFGEYEKSVLTALELEKRHPAEISDFRIRLSLLKNYLRLENANRALEIQMSIEKSRPIDLYALDEIFLALEEACQFNYDSLAAQELQFLGSIQKYFIAVMENQTTTNNVMATELLTSVYDGFFRSLEKDSLNPNFKRNLAISLLDQLRKFDLFKMDDRNFNMKTISKFSNYSEQKQKYLTDWLHR